MACKGLEGISTFKQLENEVKRGGKFVQFRWTLSMIILTKQNYSETYFIPAKGGSFKYAIKYILMSLGLGLWGIPWGPIYTVGAIVENLSGGVDVNQDVLSRYKLGKASGNMPKELQGLMTSDQAKAFEAMQETPPA